MKKFVAFAIAVAAVPAVLGPSFAQTETKPAAKPSTSPAPAKMDPAAREAAMKSVMGEIVAMDQGARTITVKHMVDRNATQTTFNVEDGAVLAAFKAGDHVKVTYAEMGEKRIARSIVKG
jgi:Cu/Ag efflux protein CusF